MEIRRARTPDELDEIRRLFREYETFLDVDLCFQGFEAELAGLPGSYAPPDGALLIAVEGRMAAGCVALRKLKDGTCEMKRLFARPRYRCRGLGRMLAERIIDEAARLGYSSLYLDTLGKLKEALRLYESLGFIQRQPYYPNPLPGVLYWELNLNHPK
ncbi:MAG: GNAT family N-acetyltransferase [Desulfobacterales bacterium]